MSTLMITILVAFIATVCAITLLAIGWLLSGRSRIVRGSCGLDPNKTRTDNCGNKSRCGICETNPPEKDKKELPRQ